MSHDPPASTPPMSSLPPTARETSGLPTYRIVLTSVPFGYREYAILPGTVLVCERCSSMVVDPVLHDQWHLRH